MHKITLRLNDEFYRWLETEAEAWSLSPANFVVAKLAELKERARARAQAPARGPGRPPDTADAKKIRELAGFLRGVYGRLKEVSAPEVYAERFEPQVEQFENLVKTKDLAGLRAFLESRPWI